MNLDKKLEEMNKYRDEKLHELEERRNQNLENFMTKSRIDILEKVEESIRKNIQHIKSSPETLEKIKVLEETNTKQNDKIDIMACQVEAMYEVFTSFSWLGRTVMKIFGGIGIIAGSILGIMELFKRAK